MSIEDMLFPPPEWLKSVPGEFECPDCNYTNCKLEFLEKHQETAHLNREDTSYILYFECSGSIDGRNAINDRIPFNPIDCTGGQCACEDDDINEFGQAVKEAADELGLDLGRVCRMPDPGLGLVFPNWLYNLWVDSKVIDLPV